MVKEGLFDEIIACLETLSASTLATPVMATTVRVAHRLDCFERHYGEYGSIRRHSGFLAGCSGRTVGLEHPGWHRKPGHRPMAAPARCTLKTPGLPLNGRERNRTHDCSAAAGLCGDENLYRGKKEGEKIDDR